MVTRHAPSAGTGGGIVGEESRRTLQRGVLGGAESQLCPGLLSGVERRRNEADLRMSESFPDTVTDPECDENGV